MNRMSQNKIIEKKTRRSSHPSKRTRAEVLMDELIQGKTPDEIIGKNGLIKQLTKIAVERALQAEMTHHLGYKAHDQAGNNTGNSRNGVSKKKIKGDSGEFEIEVPRDRAGSFEPLIIKKGQRRFTGFDEKIISLYARGMSTREISEHIKDMYATDVSPDFISTVTDSVQESIVEWQNRRLDPVYTILYLDAMQFNIRNGHKVIKMAVYLALGVNIEGHKELLGIWVQKTEGASFWLTVMTELQNRGVKDILIACMDGLSGFPEAVNSVFPETEVQSCVVHMVRNSLKFVPWKNKKEVARDLKNIYSSATLEQAELELERFSEKWDSKYPTISKSWRNKWEVFIPFLKYPDYIRKAIYTTNAIESLNMTFRKITKNRASFPTEDAAIKLLYLGLQNISRKWTRPIQNWGMALNQFAIYFEGRVPLD